LTIARLTFGRRASACVWLQLIGEQLLRLGRAIHPVGVGWPRRRLFTDELVIRRFSRIQLFLPLRTRVVRSNDAVLHRASRLQAANDNAEGRMKMSVFSPGGGFNPARLKGGESCANLCSMLTAGRV
jgi:hypothetical protein